MRPNTEMALSRRSFVKGTAGAGGLMLGWHWPQAVHAANDGASLFPNAWIKITPANEIIFYLDKAEMGQGVMTALPMILAEELEVTPEQMRVEQALPGRDEYKHAEFGIHITGGSTSVSSSWQPLRQAGAVAREMLIQAAARRWGIGKDRIQARDGRMLNLDTKESLSYGDLATDAAKLDIPGKVPLKDPRDFTVIGQSLQRLDAHAKVTGSAVYGIDVQLDGLLIAKVIRKPYLGAGVKSFNAKEALQQPGIQYVVQISSGVAVVGQTYWQVSRAAGLVQVEWHKSEHSDLSTEAISNRFRQAAKAQDGTVFADRGDTEKELSRAAKRIDAEYEIPYMAHATMEPMNCTAHVQSDRCEIWAPTQAAGVALAFAAELTGLSYDQITVHTTMIGGGFGRRLSDDYIVDAVEISLATKAPIKMQMSREDDMKHDCYRPGNFHLLSGGISQKGELLAWRHKIVGPSIMAQIVPRWLHAMAPEWIPTILKNAAGWTAGRLIEATAKDETSVEGAADMAYATEHLLVSYVCDDPGVPVGFWRSVGHSYTGFVVESFVDELAHLAGKDPFDFRRGLLTKDARRLRVLELVADKANWASQSAEGIGRGIAQVKSFGTYAAQVAEVELLDDQTIKVRRIVCALDCGLVVNPDQVRAQVESGIIFGLSAALKDPITLANGAVNQSNYHDYRVLRMNESPEIDVYLVNDDLEPRGVGEPPVPPVAAAVANAIFNLTGKRLRQLPLRL